MVTNIFETRALQLPQTDTKMHLLANKGLFHEDGKDTGVDEHATKAGHDPLE
jgi:hypothetical protein